MTPETANRLVQLRKANNLSQEELASRLNVSRQAVSKWERAESSPDTDNLIALAKLYHVTLDELLTGVPTIAPEDDAKEDRRMSGVDPENPLPDGSYFEEKARKQRNAFPYPVLVSFLYLCLGFIFNLWHPGWLIFLTIPLYYLPDSQRSPIRLLCNPVMVTIIYLLLGIECNLWHPGWLIFLAIPLFSAVTSR